MIFPLRNIKYLDFNSIKVRLKQEYEKRKRENRIFQFHKGTIKTSALKNGVFEPLSFQFHKGTIKTTEHQLEKFNKENFNSIKVRLKPAASVNPVAAPSSFQFHKGTIKTACRHGRKKVVGISIP